MGVLRLKTSSMFADAAAIEPVILSRTEAHPGTPKIIHKFNKQQIKKKRFGRPIVIYSGDSNSKSYT